MKDLIAKLQVTQAGFTLGFMRLVLGYIFFTEGSKKIFGWFGGNGMASFIGYLERLGVPFPEVNAYLTGGIEMVCGALLFIGLMTRLACIPLIITMVVAIFTAHTNGGFNYPLLIIGVCITLLQTGAGKPSVDAFCQCAGSCKVESK